MHPRLLAASSPDSVAIFSQKALLVADFVENLNDLLSKMQKALALSTTLPVERQFKLP
jgi:hypothetical protein